MSENVCKLESAIQQINNVKRNLNKNSSEVKSQIRTGISRLLEALRNREVWLLNQVDLLVSAKEEVLHHQQAELNKKLGVIQSSQGTERFELGDLKPEETPFIDFRADSSLLREQIVNYGKVDVTGVPPKSVFVSPGNPSSSLPRHFEEYEDADHHILYKTIEEVSRTKSADSCVYVSVPKLSTRTEDWLAKTKPSTSTTAISKFSFTPFSDDTKDWLLNPGNANNNSQVVTSTTCLSGSLMSTKAIPSVHSAPSLHEIPHGSSIQSWLQQIKHNPDVEDDDDFELVENSESIGSLEDLMTDSHSGISISSSRSAPQLKLPTRNKVDDISLWLHPGDKSTDQFSKTGDLFKQFNNSDYKDTEKWLVHQETGKMERLSCIGDHCKLTTFPMEIENLGDIGCLIDKNNKWIQQSKSKAVKPEVSWLCKASEQCMKIQDCISEPKCHEDMYLQKQNITCCNFSNIFEHSVTDQSKWIINESKNVQPTTCLNSTDFHITKTDLSGWLKTDQSACTGNRDTGGLPFSSRMFKQVHNNDDDKNAWLQLNQLQTTPDPTTKTEMSSLFTKFLSLQDKCDTKTWLATEKNTNIDCDKSSVDFVFEEKTNKEKWLFKSANQEQKDSGGIWFQADLEIEEIA